MPITPKVLGYAEPSNPVTPNTIYTVPATTTAIVKQIILNSDDVSYDQPLFLHLYHVPSGGSQSAANQLLTYYHIYPQEQTFIDSDIVMATGDKIIMLMNVGIHINIFLHGVEIT